MSEYKIKGWICGHCAKSYPTEEQAWACMKRDQGKSVPLGDMTTLTLNYIEGDIDE